MRGIIDSGRLAPIIITQSKMKRSGILNIILHILAKLAPDKALTKAPINALERVQNIDINCKYMDRYLSGNSN